MNLQLEFFYDYGSPYSYLANTRLPALCDRVGCEVLYRPMLLGGVFKATGNRSPAEETVEAKRRYGGLEMQRAVAECGAPFVSNPYFPINTLQIMRLAHAAIQMDVFARFHSTVFAAFWEQGLNLADPDILHTTLKDAGLDASTLGSLSVESEVKEALLHTSEEAVQRGVFGAPTFFVGNEMFFGNDRLHFVERALSDQGV